MAVRLFVGNLSYSVTAAELREHFSSVGPPSSVFIPIDRASGKPRGFAFIEYGDRAHAEEAIRRLHNQPLKGRPLAVNEARAKEDRSGPAAPVPPPRPPAEREFRPSSPRPPQAASVHSPSPRSERDTRPTGFSPPLDPDSRPTRHFGPDAAPRRREKQAKRTPKSERGPKRPMRESRVGGFLSAGKEDWEEEDHGAVPFTGWDDPEGSKDNEEKN